MSTEVVTGSVEHHHEPIERPTNQVLALLFIITVIEVLVGFVGDSIELQGLFVLREGLQISILFVLALFKGALIALYFMGIRWERRPVLVMFIAFVFPAALAVLISGLPLFG